MFPLEKTMDVPRLRELAAEHGRTWVEIDLGALERNFERIAGRLPEGGRLILSVKKDAYGHGLRALAERLEGQPRLGALGVANLEEALFLRAHGCSAEIILFTVLQGESVEAAVRCGAILTVTTLAEARAASAAAERVGMAARAHLKIDTGMGRLGRFADEIAGEVGAMRALRGLKIEGLYTHLPNAFDDKAQGQGQLAALREFQREAGLMDCIAHLGGSDVFALELRGQQGLWLRAGIALYGDHPSVAELEPVMTFKSRVVYRRRVPAGTTISYGSMVRTERETELAVVGVGYGNGYLRGVSNHGAQVLVHGRRCAVLGRVCMDQIIVDVSGATEVGVGDEAVLFGVQRHGGGLAIYPARELAGCAGTISYELMCLAGQINPRRMIQ